LTVWGQLKLSILNDEALEHGLEKMVFFSKSVDKFKSFFDICKQYSIDNSLYIDWTKWYNSKLEYSMPANSPMTLSKSTNDRLSTVHSNVYKNSTVYKTGTFESVNDKMSTTEPQSDSNKYYTHKEVIIDYDNECAKWHEMVVNWDSIVDVKKKCAKGYELTYPMYIDWLKKQSLTTLLDQDLPDTLLYIDESKLTLLDAMRK
jgi:hypothetical protein